MADVKLIPLEVLLGNPERAGAQISPDGKRLSYLAPLDGVLNVFVGDAGAGNEQPVTRDVDRGSKDMHGHMTTATSCTCGTKTEARTFGYTTSTWSRGQSATSPHSTVCSVG
jgi:hypothetical protein